MSPTVVWSYNPSMCTSLCQCVDMFTLAQVFFSPYSCDQRAADSSLMVQRLRSV